MRPQALTELCSRVRLSSGVILRTPWPSAPTGSARQPSRVSSAVGRARVREVASLEREAERVEGFYRRLLERPRPRPDRLPLRLLDAATLLFR